MRIRSGLLVLSLLVAVTASAQVISIQEVDQDGNTIPITDKSRIVDINSTLKLAIDRNALNGYIAKQGWTTVSPDLLKRLDVLTKVLQSSDKDLTDLQTQLTSFPPPGASTEQMRQYWENLSKAAGGAASLVPIFTSSPDLMQEYNGLLVASPHRSSAVEQYRLFFQVATNEANRLQAQFATAANTSGVYVQLGGFVEDRPFHIEGFDTLAPGEKYVVERFNLALSDEEKQRLTAYASLATQVNQKGTAALLSWKNFGNVAITAYLDSTQSGQCVQKLDEQVTTARDQLKDQKQAIVAALNKLRDTVTDYEKTVRDIRAKYATGGSAGSLPADQFLIGTNNDIQTLVQSTSTLQSSLISQATDLNNLATNAITTTASTLKSLSSSATNCASLVGNDAQALKSGLQQRLQRLLGEEQFSTAALELGDQVTKLTVDKLPDSVSIPLIYTGRREPGDHVTIRFAAGTPTSARQTVYEKTLVMYRVLTHLDLKANLIWAHPQKSTDVHHFQAAPAYNVLLKKGSRTSAIWDNLIDVGIGFNLAALDFNHDDSQELGIGLAVSALRDFISAGYGYNVALGKRYWFFGLRLPLPGITVPGAQVATPPAATPAQ